MAGSDDGDRDGLTDDEEAKLGTEPISDDTDGDGVLDGDELKAGTDPLDADSDDDKISDGDELNFGSNPLSTDTDGDGFSDTQEYEWGWENRRGAGAHIFTPANATADDVDGDGVSNATERHFGTDPTIDESKAAGGPGDAAVVRQLYETEKTGRPIGDADLRQQYGIPATEQEERELADEQFDMAFSDNVLERERFYESTGEPGPAEHQAELAQFWEDQASADVDRDPQAFVDARAARGLDTTPEDIDRFLHPTAEDLFSAGRSTSLIGTPVPDDSALGGMLTGALTTALGSLTTDEAEPAVEWAGTRTVTTSAGTTTTTTTGPGSGNDVSGNDVGAGWDGLDPGSAPSTGGSGPATGGTTATNATNGTTTDPAQTGVTPQPPAPAGETTEGSDVVVRDGEGNTYVNHPDGSATTYDAAGNVTYDSSAERASLAATGSTANWKDYVSPDRASAAPAAPAAAGSATATDESADDEEPKDDASDTEPTDDNGDGDDEDDEDDDDAEEEDDGSEPDDESDEGMRDPDAAGGNVLGVSVDGSGDLETRLFGSSTGLHGGATDTGRGDLDNGLGDITGEVRTTNTAGPDVNPDADDGSVDGVPVLTRLPDGGDVDGPRPELEPFLFAPEGPPDDDGIDPYASLDNPSLEMDVAVGPDHDEEVGLEAGFGFGGPDDLD
jgi:hypothetical protein